MSGPQEPIEATFMWRQRIGAGLRNVPMTVVWQQVEDVDGDRTWAPVKVAVEAGGNRLTPSTLQSAPWAFAIEATDPNNYLDDLAPIQIPEGTTVLLDTVSKRLGPRLYNALRRAGVATVQQVRDMTDGELLQLDALGTKSLERARSLLGPAPADKT